jgi:hypothetical protein
MTYNEVAQKKFIPHQKMTFTTGTWTDTFSGGRSSNVKTAGDTTSTVDIPIDLPRRSGEHGVKLTSLQVAYRCTTAALDAAPSLVLYRQEYDLVTAAADGDVVAATVATTGDGVVAADAQDRIVTFTVDEPDWDYSTEGSCTYFARLTLDAGASSVVSVLGAFVNYNELT